MSKKKRKACKAKQRMKRQQKKTRARLPTSRSGPPPSRSHTSPSFMMGGALGETSAPEGFRPITSTQAMIEYGKPLVDAMGGDSVEALNSAFGMVTLLWNLSIAYDQDDCGDPISMRKKVVDDLMKTLKQSKQEVEALIDEMLERKAWLLPPDIQPRFSMTMFIRKEKRHEIPDFKESELDLSDAGYEPSAEDDSLRVMLVELDAMVAECDYSEWESHFFRTSTVVVERFSNWLELKEQSEYLETFAYAVETYFRFAFCYDGCDLSSPASVQLDDFFQGYVLRKVHLECPDVFAQWPVALKLFYDFLSDIGYVEDSATARERISMVQSDFINTLKSMFE